MKTVVLTLVTEDDDLETMQHEIQDALENTSLGAFPMFSWKDRDATRTETKWYKKEYVGNR
jgi:hypothetical protein